jgi:pyridoxal phosphate enzyme (YggS family)
MCISVHASSAASVFCTTPPDVTKAHHAAHKNVSNKTHVLRHLSQLIMSPIKANLQHIQREIKRAAERTSSDKTTIQNAPSPPISLIAVSKTKPAAMLRDAFAAGQRLFGENYVQEGIAKIAELADLRAQGIEWHFIGPLQSNKAKLVAQHFDWVHGVDRLKIAEALAKNRVDWARADYGPLNICIQVNVSGEASKGGVTPEQTLDLAKQIVPLAGIKLRGLMTIIENTPDEAMQRAQFSLLRTLQEQLLANGIALDTLSMGMSQDFRAAIAEGATMVRIGSAIFGARDSAATSEPGSAVVGETR